MGTCASRPNDQQRVNKTDSLVEQQHSRVINPSTTIQNDRVKNMEKGNQSRGKESTLDDFSTSIRLLAQIEKGNQPKIKEKQVSDVSIRYQQYIEKHIGIEVDIDGVGNLQFSLGNSDRLFQWYSDGIKQNMFNGTVYDALSLCFLALKNNDKQIERGVHWYRSLIDQYPQNYKLLYGYANILYLRQCYEQSMDYYKSVIELRSNWTPPHQCLALIYQFKRVNKIKAVESAKQILVIDSKNRIGRYVQALNHADDKIRLEKLEAVSRQYPRFAQVRNQIGKIYGETSKDYKKAIQFYKKGIEHTPDYAAFYNNIGVNYELMQEPAEAMRWYFEAIKRDHQYRAPYGNLIDLFEQQSLRENQIKSLVLQNKQNLNQFWLNIGIVYLERKKTMYALRCFNKIIKSQQEELKQKYKIYNLIGQAYYQENDNQKSLHFFQKSVEENPNFYESCFNIAKCFDKKQNFPQAIEWYGKAIKLKPYRSETYKNIGDIYKNEEEYDTAKQYYKTAIDYQSTHSIALTNLGVCFYRLNCYRESFYSFYQAQQCIQYDSTYADNGKKLFVTLSRFGKLRDQLKKSRGLASQMQNGGYDNEIPEFQKQELEVLVQQVQQILKKTEVATESARTLISKDDNKQKILQIINAYSKDKKLQSFTLKSIFDKVRSLFNQNEQFFNIIPQVLVVHYLRNTLMLDYKKVLPNVTLEIEKELFSKISQYSMMASQDLKKNYFKPEDVSKRNNNILLKNQKKFQHLNTNVLQNRDIKNYQDLHKIIVQLYISAQMQYNKKIKPFINQILKSTKGTLSGMFNGVPTNPVDQFKYLFRLFQRIFKQQLSERKSVVSIITKFNKFLEIEKINDKVPSINEMLRVLTKAWKTEITQIIKKRRTDKKQIVCELNDLISTNIIFKDFNELKKTIQFVDACAERGKIQIVKYTNCLDKSFVQSVAVSIRIQNEISDIQLAMQLPETPFNFIYYIYDIQKSPLGCLLGSVMFLARGSKLSLVQNCSQIVQKLKGSANREDAETVKTAQLFMRIIGETVEGERK